MPSKLTGALHESGPFFRLDPVKTFRENVRLMMEAVAREGASDVQQRMRADEPKRYRIRRGGGRVSDHVQGRVHSLGGHAWRVTAVVSVNAVDAVDEAHGKSIMAAASTVEGESHPFRRMTASMRNARAVATADMAKGLD